MAPRPYWKGYLKLSLVSCPIALYPAIDASERVSFRQVNKQTGNRLRQQLVDTFTGQLVEAEEKGRGYELGENQFLVVEDEELEKAREGARTRLYSAAPVAPEGAPPSARRDAPNVDSKRSTPEPYILRHLGRGSRTRVRSRSNGSYHVDKSTPVITTRPTTSRRAILWPGGIRRNPRRAVSEGCGRDGTRGPLQPGTADHARAHGPRTSRQHPALHARGSELTFRRCRFRRRCSASRSTSSS